MPSGAPRTTELVDRLVVLLAVLRAATRVGWHERRVALPALAEILRDVEADLTRVDPSSMLAVVEALLPLAPPRGAGRCLKRSLLLLDLWSRAGLDPALHLGLRSGAGEGSRGHAWVTTRRDELATFQPPDVTEVWTG